MIVALAPLAVSGLVLGSLLPVAARRLLGDSTRFARQIGCAHCGDRGAWHEASPTVRYAARCGRCRSCAHRLPLAGTLAELATAALVVGCVAAFGLSARALVAAAFCTVLVLIAAIDIERRIVPNRIVIPAALAVLAAQTALQPGLQWLLAALGAAALLLVLALVNPGGMGMGDVKLALLIGAGLGRAVPLALILGFVAAIVPALVLVARHGRAVRGKGIAFAPYLAFGAIATLFLEATLLRPGA